jgi:Raf kinase inhibitor-like YbhB/YbcL family protein
MHTIALRLMPVCVGLLTTLISATALAQQGDGTRVAIQTHVFKPRKVEPSNELVARVRAPEGFEVSIFAKDLMNARILAVGADGTVYVSRREQGDVLMLKDVDRDGRADSAPTTVANRPGAHGIAVHAGKFYLATVKEVFVADIRSDGGLGQLNMLMGDLPDAGQHANRTLAMGPDGMLYISVGSTCNACNESNPENATLLRVMPDGKSRTVFASGLRNTIGFGWQPQTGELWGMDQGIDFLGDGIQPEELNKIELGKNYGWPHVWGHGEFNPQSTPPGGITKAQWKAQSVPMTLGYEAHAAPMQLVFYSGSMYPADYRGDAFVTMRGSWNRDPAAGYEVAHVNFQDGKPTGITPFVTGFLSDGGKAHIARPVGLVQAVDGALLMADDANGVIYRIAHAGGNNPTKGSVAVAPPDVMRAQVARGTNVPLALQRTSASGQRGLDVSSQSFAAGTRMPVRHSEYFDGVSPALRWTAVAGAQSYLLIVEDPDATPIKPYVHWVVWNIPASVTSLPEGLQEQPRLTVPEGVLQGRTSRGTVGYLGPRPPPGDPPHHYHFQVFALDTYLDVPPGADRDQVLQAASGHVLAKGEIVGLYQQTLAPPK